jgi:hypothetical protein
MNIKFLKHRNGDVSFQRGSEAFVIPQDEFMPFVHQLTFWIDGMFGEGFFATEEARQKALEVVNSAPNKQSKPCSFEFNHLAYKSNHFTYCQHCGVKL